MSLSEIFIALSFFLILYTYLLYPILIFFLSRIIHKSVSKDLSFEPPITVLVAAYNEEKYIEDCIKSIYNSNYPTEKIRVLIGDDGSKDNTNVIVRELMLEYPLLQILNYNRNGKNYIINKLVELSETEILVFIDADCRFEKEAIKNIVANLADEEVGGAMVSLDMIDSGDNNNTGRFGESTYQNLEKLIRKAESRIYSTVNSLGIFCMRKKLFRYFPNNNICDDLFSAYNINKNRKRFIYEEAAIAYEVREKSFEDERNRRKRILAGGLSTLLYFRELLLPHYGLTSLFLWSHKFLRYFSPFYFLGILISTFFLNSDSIIFQILLVFQAVIYLSVIPALYFEKKQRPNFYFRIILILIGMNFSFLLGWIQFFTKNQNGSWERSDTKQVR